MGEFRLPLAACRLPLVVGEEAVMKLQVLRSKTALERLEWSRRRDYARAGKKEDECECTRKSKRGKSRGSETTKNGLARWSRFALASARAGSFGLLLSDEWRREWARLEPEKELDIQRETPHSRRETLVGASCCTGSLDGSLDVTRSQSSLSWNLAKGSRRLCNSVLLLSFVSSRSSARAESEQQVYVSSDNGFKILPPPEWEQGSKSGAAILFKDPSYKFNNLGVTVTPVRVSKLEEFGSVEDAANKLIAFEKGKVSFSALSLSFSEGGRG